MIQGLLKSVRSTLKNYRTLSTGFGQFHTIRHAECVDREGNVLPWFTYPAIEYIKQLDLSDKTVFEYGSGFSTLFWAGRTKRVVSVEDDRKWYERMKPRLPGNVEYVLAEDRKEYVNTVTRFEGKFDIVVNDGIERLECALASTPKLAEGGLVVLDNSDWCLKTAEYYRDTADLIEVDMAGFGPINDYTWITSFFLSRSARLKPAGGKQPKYGVGNWKISEAELSEWIRG